MQYDIENVFLRAMTLWLEAFQLEFIWKSYELIKLWDSWLQVGNVGNLLGSPETKSHFNLVPIVRCKVYYREESGGLSQVCMCERS
jgi:hypothetical protein